VIERVSGLKSSKQAPIGWAHAASIVSYIADLERGEREGHTITTSPHHSKDNPGTLRASGFGRPAEGPQEGRPHGASDKIFGKIESEKRSLYRVGLLSSDHLGAQGCPNRSLPKSAKCFEIW
jgi:hypothetical protein